MQHKSSQALWKLKLPFLTLTKTFKICFAWKTWVMYVKSVLFFVNKYMNRCLFISLVWNDTKPWEIAKCKQTFSGGVFSVKFQPCGVGRLFEYIKKHT